ncbi:MAG: DUF2332 domain-containing protein [Ktedonobacteraceae bacterium]
MPIPFSDPRHWLDRVPQTLHASPLYRAFWEQTKDDPELLALLELVPKDQPLPITFFTAVNYLVLGEPHNPLLPFYPSSQPEQTRPATEVAPVFRAFVLDHREALQALLPTARLQTNEVTRCANLLPAFLLAYRRGKQKALNLLEIGSSAGLNLLWYRYGYRYRYEHEKQGLEDLRFNGVQSPVQIQCQLNDVQPFPLTPTTALPRVARCEGIEICPRDLHNEQDMRWVRAAIWPEEVERQRTLDAALALARSVEVPVHKGDACDLLPELLAAMPLTHTAVVWHSFAVNQGPREVKELLHVQMAEASHQRPIYRIALEVEPAAPLPCLQLSEYQNGRMVSQEVLAHCALHGERMTWLADLPSL